MGQPTIVATVEQLRRYMVKDGLTTAAFVALLDTFSGVTWNDALIDDVFAGRKKFTEYQDQIIKLYLLDRFFIYNNS
jgi:hypothetical protein